MTRAPLLLLPGMMCDARLFGPQLDALADAADCRVADLTLADTVAGLAADALAQALWPRFALAGLSMGGIVAMEILRQAPERVTHFALLDTNHRAETPERRALRAPQIERALKGELRSLLVEEMKPLYLAAANRGDQRLLDLVLDMALSLGPEVFRRQSLALERRPDSADTLRAVRRPALVLCGAEDHLCPPERHEEMARLIPGAGLVLVEGAGHLSTLEAPGAVSLALRRLLERPA